MSMLMVAISPSNHISCLGRKTRVGESLWNQAYDYQTFIARVRERLRSTAQ